MSRHTVDEAIGGAHSAIPGPTTPYTVKGFGSGGAKVTVFGAGETFVNEGYAIVVADKKIAEGLAMIAAELIRAMEKFPDNSVFRSRHEGYGVLLEEVDELWDAIKNNDHGTGKSQDAAEAVQVGAMALHYLKDFGGGNE